MIYFGYDGYGPWSSPSGFIWFFGGIIFLMTIGIIRQLLGNKFTPQDKLWAILVMSVICVSVSALSGYYFWFAGVRAQYNQKWEDCQKAEYERNICAKQVNEALDRWIGKNK